MSSSSSCINSCCWFDQEPMVGEIMSFLPPSEVFLDMRMICKRWKEWIESESFSKVYFRRVVGNCSSTNSDHLLFHIDLSDTLNGNLPFKSMRSLVSNKMNSEEKLIRIFTLLERVVSTPSTSSHHYRGMSELSWREHFYYKTLFCIGLNNKCRAEHHESVQPLKFLEESLTPKQLGFMIGKFKKWGLGNMLKPDLIVGLFHHPMCFIMFRDCDGSPFVIDCGGDFNGIEILNYSKVSGASLFDDDDGGQEGVQVENLEHFINNNQQSSIVSSPFKLNQSEIAMWEDYLTCLHPTMRRQRVQHLTPFVQVRQTSKMSDYQHVELCEKAAQDYHTNIYQKWRPNVTTWYQED